MECSRSLTRAKTRQMVGFSVVALTNFQQIPSLQRKSRTGPPIFFLSISDFLQLKTFAHPLQPSNFSISSAPIVFLPRSKAKNAQPIRSLAQFLKWQLLKALISRLVAIPLVPRPNVLQCAAWCRTHANILLL